MRLTPKMAADGEKKGKRSSKNSGKPIEISEKCKQDIQDAFNVFDTDNQGTIPVNKLKLAMRALGFEPRKEEIKKILEEFGSASDGVFFYEDFFQLMSRKISEKDVNEEIMKAFQFFDLNSQGKISFDNLKKVSTELGESLTDEEIHEMIAEADRDGDGCVDKDEFFRIMKKTCLY